MTHSYAYPDPLEAAQERDLLRAYEDAHERIPDDVWEHEGVKSLADAIQVLLDRVDTSITMLDARWDETDAIIKKAAGSDETSGCSYLRGTLDALSEATEILRNQP